MENNGRIGHHLSSFGRRFRMVCRTLAFVLIFCAIGGASGSDPVRDAQIGTLLFVAGFAAFGALKRALTPPIALLFAYSLVCWASLGQDPHGLEQFGCVAGATIVALWLKRQEALAAMLSYSGALEAVFGLAQWLGWNPWNYANAWELHKPTGTFGQETVMGAFLVACLAPALFQRRWWCAAPIAACVAATHSSMSSAGAAAVVLLWLYTIVQPYVAFTLIFSCVAGILALYKTHPGLDWLDPNGRLLFWRIGWARFMVQPIFGFGPGSWLSHAPTIAMRLTHLHNEFLEFLTEYGTVGGLISGWSIFDFIRKFKFTWERAMCVGLLVDAFGSFPFHIASIGTIFLTGWLLSVQEKPLVLSLYGQGGQH